MSSLRMLLLTAPLFVAVTGCGSARLLQATPDGGVVAIPSNSNTWPCYYRDRAEQLIARQCPDGYDIVAEKTVVGGEKSSTSQLVDRTSPLSRAVQRDRTASYSLTPLVDTLEYQITYLARHGTDR